MRTGSRPPASLSRLAASVRDRVCAAVTNTPETSSSMRH
ncbi:hypothetical protein BUH_1089 [Burkholderia pseudomallei Pakistan 9]|nr:hypothetical protein BUH_1089 [Burkholderia pseudomallei Pakistan 9]